MHGIGASMAAQNPAAAARATVSFPQRPTELPA
jgi:hypothetical protein